MSKSVVIVDGIRTPIGNFCGGLSTVSAKDLAKITMKHIVDKNQLDKEAIDEIIVGNVAQSTDAPNLGRVAALELGFPHTVSAYVVNRNCASGMQAVVNGVQSILTGDTSIHLAVGAENMSQMPYIVRGARQGFKANHRQFIDSMTEMLEDPVVKMMMGETAEVVAEEENVSREEQDEFAYHSHQKAVAAQKENRFQNEIVPVPIYRKGKKIGEISQDEGPKEDISLEKLAALRTVFKENGTVTPGNACSTNDGAAAVLLMDEEKALELGYQPKARIVSYAFVGLDPKRMGLGPVYAVRKALKKANMDIQDIDLVELNEAFAAQAIPSIRKLELDVDRVNIFGGGIALGHPVGATGVRLLVTLMNALETRQKKYGVATLCVGGGLGGAVIIENLHV
ncbi:thiolase family protein [Aliibacillus thermotolerans]|uniref:acetyl-CoA C-acyltransferase n=1 Tax=Aliibacillus thermotolerans TaxID=1834418 RepID=A0ABW0U8T6_9BACI|nr:thiolase family protein [Aliibacillus thermotolerans]MDA3128782.1 acetyl-CoA C-acyltransferase [Aliibacillus thermotolerans]